MAGVATTVPKDGRIEYIFPPESNKLPYETGKECQLVRLLIHPFCLFQIYENSNSCLPPNSSMFSFIVDPASAPSSYLFLRFHGNGPRETHCR